MWGIASRRCQFGPLGRRCSPHAAKGLAGGPPSDICTLFGKGIAMSKNALLGMAFCAVVLTPFTVLKGQDSEKKVNTSSAAQEVTAPTPQPEAFEASHSPEPDIPINHGNNAW